jgi:hypothetical protein
MELIANQTMTTGNATMLLLLSLFCATVSRIVPLANAESCKYSFLSIGKQVENTPNITGKNASFAMGEIKT